MFKVASFISTYFKKYLIIGIDKNARIGANCRIGIDNIDRANGEYPTHYMVDGIIVIPKNTIVPEGTVI